MPLTASITFDAPRPPLLVLRQIGVRFTGAAGDTVAVRDVSLEVQRGECRAVVGESGSGKSQTFLGLLGLLPANGMVAGSARLDGRELIGLPARAMNRVRGAEIGMIFQDPLSALAPHIRIGDQIADPLRRHRGLSRTAALHQARDWLDRVRIDDAGARLRQYPHELSGGMRQRVMIAAALACAPKLVIADEPTTALDVRVQAEVLDLIDELVRGSDTGLIIITHDMGVVARMADRVSVMRRGEVVEEGDAAAVLTAPRHDYTRALLGAVSPLAGAGRPGRAELAPVAADAPGALTAENLSVVFRSPGLLKRTRARRAVDGVGFIVRAGETLGIVGESGCGKSTLARAALRLIAADAGAVTFLGRTVGPGDRAALARLRRDLAIVFQNPLGSLDPRMTVGRSVAEPLLVHRPHLSPADRHQLVTTRLDEVGLSADFATRYPREVSGGQAQRAGIARAIVLDPKVIVCDEAVSALDLTVRAQVVDLLIGLQRRKRMAMVFIGHDLGVVREVAHRVLVLHAGRVVEEGPTETVLSAPVHPYTRALVAAVLSLDPASRPRRAA